MRQTGVVAEHESRLGNVVGKKCPLAISMRSQSRSIPGVHIIPDNLAQGECEWVGFHSGERTEEWRGFKQSMEQLRDMGVQRRQGEVRVNGGLSAWWQTHTECFMHRHNAGTDNWHTETESCPKRPRQAGPGVLQGVQDLIAELVAKGYRIVYTDGSSKRPRHKDMRRVGVFGVFAAEDEQGPEVRFCGYVPTRHRQTNNGAELWAALEAL